MKKHSFKIKNYYEDNSNKSKTINEYINLENKPLKIYDEFKNELVFCNGIKVKPYFRKKLKKNPNPTLMTEWHEKCQSFFLQYKERTYRNEKMIKKFRRADVDLNSKQIIEFQYSHMEQTEALNRKKDWATVNKEIIWIIYGDDTIEVTELKHSGRIFLEFVCEPWKYRSYTDYDFIYIDIKDKIYKINPSMVKSNMIDIQKPIDKLTFIKSLKKRIDVFNDDKVYQTRIYVKQQGAGNGKTYGVIQLIENEKFYHYDTFIYLTKQHSAVHVIKEELNDQLKRKELKNTEIISDKLKAKKHIISFKNTKTNKQRKIIIGTFDSFVWALGNQKAKGIDKFVVMVNSIINDEIKCSENGYVKYATGIKLDKKLLLIGDEMQDLRENYIKAIIKITRDRYVDFFGVGDILQSISIKKNSFYFLMEKELPTDSILVTKYTKQNICRRFIDNKLIEFVNSAVPFEKYSLPKVSP